MRIRQREKERERQREIERGGESGKRLFGDGGTSFDPVRSTRVLQVRRSLGPDHSLNMPRRTCLGIIHCLYFPLLSSPFPTPPASRLVALLRSHPDSRSHFVSFSHPFSRFSLAESPRRRDPNVPSSLPCLALLLAVIEVHSRIPSLTFYARLVSAHPSNCLLCTTFGGISSVQNGEDLNEQFLLKKIW